MTNCKNCGAPIEGGKCQYCGTEFEACLDMAIGKVVNVSFEHDGRTVEFRMRVSGLELDHTPEVVDLYEWGGTTSHVMRTDRYQAAISGSVVPYESHGSRCLAVVKERL